MYGENVSDCIHSVLYVYIDFCVDMSSGEEHTTQKVFLKCDEV